MKKKESYGQNQPILNRNTRLIKLCFVQGLCVEFRCNLSRHRFKKFDIFCNYLLASGFFKNCDEKFWAILDHLCAQKLKYSNLNVGKWKNHFWISYPPLVAINLSIYWYILHSTNIEYIITSDALHYNAISGLPKAEKFGRSRSFSLFSLWLRLTKF